MTQDDLTQQVDELALAVVSDPRWQNDTLGVAVLGMLIYGYAMAIGRMVMLLNVEDIDAAVVRSLTSPVGAAKRWSTGLVAEANASAFDESHHPGNFELIGVGHSYFGEDDKALVVDNVFANIASARQRAPDTDPGPK